MKKTKILMGMNINVEIADSGADRDSFNKVFSFFEYVDRKFSTYKKDSEISRINEGAMDEADYSADMKMILSLAEETKKLTYGYFDIRTPSGSLDPSGLVKGWAILRAAEILEKEGFKNFYIDAGGDIEARGLFEGMPWKIGIRNPFNPEKEIVKVVSVGGDSGKRGLATSGTYARGAHIYNPRNKGENLEGVVSISVVGPNVYEADRFATAAFAMGREGINFLERLPGFEGYMIDRSGTATYTSNFEKYVK